MRHAPLRRCNFGNTHPCSFTRTRLLAQFLQHFSQHIVALIEAGNCIHNLVVRSVATSLIQLYSQISQFLGMGSIVANHVLHQRQELVHRGVAVMMLVTMLMQMIVVVGMLVRMSVLMMMLVGMGMTVVGVLMGMCVGMLMAVFATADMIVIDVHSIFSLKIIL